MSETEGITLQEGQTTIPEERRAEIDAERLRKEREQAEEAIKPGEAGTEEQGAEEEAAQEEDEENSRDDDEEGATV